MTSVDAKQLGHASSYAERITSKLTTSLAPSKLEVTDQSHLHAGHAGARPEGETHFHVLVVAKRFDGLNRVARQRLIYETLKEEMAERVHALSMQALTPAEAIALRAAEET